MVRPLVSVIIPAYNRPRKTQRAIESVSEQTYSPIELVVVDDGSQPPLRDELSLPESKFKNIVFKEHQKNQGGNIARNTGIENTSGEYIAFLDSDDEWDPEKIETQIQKLITNEAYVSYTGVQQLDSGGKINAIKKATQSGHLLDELLNGNLIGTFSSVVVRAETVDQAGKPDPDMPCWQDWEWYLRLAAEGLQFDAVEDPLTIRHNESGDIKISRSYTPKRNEAYPVIRSRIEDLASTPEQKKVGLAYLDFHLGYAALANKHYSEARQLFISAAKKHPKEKLFFVYLFCAGPHYPAVRLFKRYMFRIIKTA